MSILIVDDDPAALMMLEHTLASAGESVQTATDGREALRMLKEGECRLVVSDWEMPGMDGLDLCRAVRAEELPGYVYFILLTGRDSTDDAVAGLTAGADDFISKPFNPAELTVRVRTGQRILQLETRDMAIFAMAKLAESRDPETGSHLERVRGTARLLARQLARADAFRELIDGEFIRLIYETSPLHDIGKVGIPDAVLLKAGRLSDREFGIMKAHSRLGAETLDAALQRYPHARFLRMARDIALSHHERVDGTGYPDGLRADAIPLAARITALADVYDALTSKRVYKPSFAHEVARGIILQESGTHFDVAIVDAFVKCEDEFVAIRKRFD